jgi:hypothetical protein
MYLCFQTHIDSNNSHTYPHTYALTHTQGTYTPALAPSSSLSTRISACRSTQTPFWRGTRGRRSTKCSHRTSSRCVCVCVCVCVLYCIHYVVGYIRTIMHVRGTSYVHVCVCVCVFTDRARGLLRHGGVSKEPVCHHQRRVGSRQN